MYYYDQAGNLVQTVPPKGVQPLAAPDISYVKDGNNLNPSHFLKTKYKYNSLNQLVWQKTPDAGISEFWYDDKSQLRLSQNARQRLDTAYSYSKYDEQGRVTEVGELSGLANVADLRDSIQNINFPGYDQDIQDVTLTRYDAQNDGNEFVQENLRTRVASVRVIDRKESDTVSTYYSYDIHGNVSDIVQSLPVLENKRIHYVYDLVSGNVNYVMYQYGEDDQFIHRYNYDADNRIEQVRTSTDGYIWDTDAKYSYYQHGPLARTELGEYSIQAEDYYYTLQGWIKGVNQPFKSDPDDLNPIDMNIPEDAFSYTLGYYSGDYLPIGNNLTTSDARDQVDEINGKRWALQWEYCHDDH